MRHLGLLGIVMCALGVVAGRRAQAAEPITADQLVGTWKLVSVRHGGYPDLFNYGTLSKRQTVKHVTPTHMMTVTYGEDGTVLWGAGGVFTLKEGKYTETIEYGRDPFGRPFDGKSKYEFDIKIVRGTTLYLTLDYEGGGKRDELWERIEGKAPDAAKPAKTKPDEHKPAGSSATEVETPDDTKPEKPNPANGDIEKRGSNNTPNH